MKADIAMAVVGLAGLAFFLGLVIWRVPELPLIIVFTSVFLMAAYDFWLELQYHKNNQS